MQEKVKNGVKAKYEIECEVCERRAKYERECEVCERVKYVRECEVR